MLHLITIFHVIAEKEIVAVSSIVDELMHYLVTENDCYLASKEEQDKLTEVVLAGGKLNRKMCRT